MRFVVAVKFQVALSRIGRMGRTRVAAPPPTSVPLRDLANSPAVVYSPDDCLSAYSVNPSAGSYEDHDTVAIPSGVPPHALISRSLVPAGVVDGVENKLMLSLFVDAMIGAATASALAMATQIATPSAPLFCVIEYVAGSAPPAVFE